METGDVLEGSVVDCSTGPGPSVTAWRIRRGCIQGVDVSRQIVLAVAQLTLVDERANPEQVLALVDAFGGRLGFSQVPITYRLHGRRGVVSVPRRLKFAFVLDPEGTARASELWVNLPEHGLVSCGGEIAVAYREFHLRSEESEEMEESP
ncbi:MAG: hypothetical protein ACRDZ7_12000 [Acidimicrobiia bacterium]